MSTYQEQRDRLKEVLYDAFVDGPVIRDERTGGVLVAVDDAVDASLRVMTDGDNFASFFNRCPACSCECAADANRSDCGCWCHDPDNGWKVWVEKSDELFRALSLARSMLLSGDRMTPSAERMINDTLGLGNQ